MHRETKIADVVNDQRKDLNRNSQVVEGEKPLRYSKLLPEKQEEENRYQN